MVEVNCYRLNVDANEEGNESRAADPLYPFEFALARRPVSQQARRSELRVAWQQEVRREARRRWRGSTPTDGHLALTITYFFDGGAPDVDSIPKPILNALKGIIYADDTQVSDLTCRKRNLRDDVVLRNPSPYLLAHLRRFSRVLHVSAAQAAYLEVTF